jgi:hypothetical protein
MPVLPSEKEEVAPPQVEEPYNSLTIENDDIANLESAVQSQTNTPSPPTPTPTHTPTPTMGKTEVTSSVTPTALPTKNS